MRNLAAHSSLHGECFEAFDGDVDSAHELPFRCHSLVRVENPKDRLCLARAINIGLKYRECDQQRSQKFKEYIQDQSRHEPAARYLLLAARIDANKDFYGIEDAIKLQDLLNVRYGQHEIRLVIFSAASQNKIIWKGWNGRPAKFNLCLYHARDHFSFMASPKAILKVLLI